MIDSELVPWGKGEKQAGEADEIEPETMCLQGTEAQLWFRLKRATVCLLKNEPTSLGKSFV